MTSRTHHNLPLEEVRVALDGLLVGRRARLIGEHQSVNLPEVQSRDVA